MKHAQFKPGDGFQVFSSDRLGWTNEADAGIISVDVQQPGNRTVGRTLPVSGGQPVFPTLNSTYQFDRTNVSLTPSIAIEIDPSKRPPGDTLN